MLSDVASSVVSLKSFVLGILELGVLGIFSHVAIVIADHLHEEGLCLWLALLAEDFVIDHADDLFTVGGELILDLSLVLG